MDNKYKKLSIVKPSKRCKLMPKMYQNTLVSRAVPGPAGELKRSPRSPGNNDGGLLLRMGGKGRYEKEERERGKNRGKGGERKRMGKGQ